MAVIVDNKKKKKEEGKGCAVLEKIRKGVEEEKENLWLIVTGRHFALI